MAKAAVILLAHGTPDTLDEIPEYLRNVTSGRPMPESVIAEIRHRYSLIGQSPLTRLTMEQARLLAEHTGVPVYVGMRNWKPYVVDTVRQMRADGVTHAVAICLAPQNSRTSVGLYRRAVFAEAGGAIKIEFIEGWAAHPLLVQAFAERLKVALAGATLPVLFTAHSVPCRTIQTQPASEGKPALPPDPYPVDAKTTAALVAQHVPALTWYFAFQSQGMSGGPWIGPTVEDTLSALRSEGATTVMIQPVGFLCDHVEILYDIDIGFLQFSTGIGLEIKRPESLNDSPLLTAALADLTLGGLTRLGA